MQPDDLVKEEILEDQFEADEDDDMEEDCSMKFPDFGADEANFDECVAGGCPLQRRVRPLAPAERSRTARRHVGGG